MSSPIKKWNIAITPSSFDPDNEESVAYFQKYLDLSTLINVCAQTVNFDLDSHGLLHIVFRDEVPDIILSQVFQLAGKRFEPDAESQMRELNFALCLVDIIEQDTIIQVELEYEDGTFEMRTFKDVSPDLDLSCCYQEEDLDLINFKALQQGYYAVPFVDSTFLAFKYSDIDVERSSSRIASGYHDSTPVTCFCYIELMAEWLDTLG